MLYEVSFAYVFIVITDYSFEFWKSIFHKVAYRRS